jgi:hypothetical protein
LIDNLAVCPICNRISGLVVEYITAIDVTRIRFLDDALDVFGLKHTRKGRARERERERKRV